jgi:hypothetical protein
MKNSGPSEGRPAAELIDERIAELGDWRGETLRRMRQLIREADPEGEKVDAAAFKALVRSAIALNASGAKANAVRTR